jgi:hypothetical protein
MAETGDMDGILVEAEEACSRFILPIRRGYTSAAGFHFAYRTLEILTVWAQQPARRGGESIPIAGILCNATSFEFGPTSFKDFRMSTTLRALVTQTAYSSGLPIYRPNSLAITMET